MIRNMLDNNSNIFEKLSVRVVEEYESNYQIISAEVDGMVVEVARARFAIYALHNGQWIAKTPGLLSAWENEEGHLLFSPEINKVLLQHFAKHQPLRPYKNTAQKLSLIETNVGLAIQYGFRTNGWCLMRQYQPQSDESFFVARTGAGAGSETQTSPADNQHWRVSPFFATQQEAEKLLLALEEQVRFRVKQVVLPTAAYPVILPAHTFRGTGNGSNNSSGHDNNERSSNYYITAGDYNSCPYDAGNAGDGYAAAATADEANPWAVPKAKANVNTNTNTNIKK
jgi:hypothetical protein